MESGKSEERAYAICTAQFLKKHGITPQEADKRGWLEETIEKLALEDLELLDEEELADFAAIAEEGDWDTSMLQVWKAPASRKDVPESHFFWPEKKAYPYRNPDGSVNCAGVMAAWRMAHGARSGQKAPDWLIARIKPYVERCQKRKAGEDVEFDDIYEREFDMPECFLQTTSQEMLLEDEERKMLNIQVLRSGAFKHPEYGKIEFNDKMFDSFIKNFDSRVPQEHIAYDFKHRPDWGAAAWLKRLFKDGDGLWAEVELTRRGLEALKNKEFLFFSTEYVDNYKDRESGKSYGPTILGGGLTNRPFIKGMAPVMLSGDETHVFEEIEASATNEEIETMDKILEQLNALREELASVIANASTKEDIQAALTAYGDKIKALEDQLEEARKSVEEKAGEMEALKADKEKLEESNKNLAESLENVSKTNEESRKKLHVMGVEAYCTELTGIGIWPATAAVVKDILLASDDEAVVTLSEGEGEDRKETKLDLKAVITKVLESIPSDFRVDTDEETTHQRKEGDDKSLTAAEVEEYAKKHELSYREALRKLSEEGRSF
jgi:hypothetical protein